MEQEIHISRSIYPVFYLINGWVWGSYSISEYTYVYFYRESNESANNYKTTINLLIKTF